MARAVRDRLALDQVWLAPTGRQPLKPGGPAVSFADRLRMTELLCGNERGLQATAIDAPRPDGEPNYTVNTLRRLKETLPPGAQIFAILGADAFLGLPQWRGVPDLFALAEWVVVSRPGFPLNDVQGLSLTQSERARLHILPELEDPTSATALRGRLRAGLPCGQWLPDPVLHYIQEHGLYQA